MLSRADDRNDLWDTHESTLATAPITYTRYRQILCRAMRASICINAKRIKPLWGGSEVDQPIVRVNIRAPRIRQAALDREWWSPEAKDTVLSANETLNRASRGIESLINAPYLRSYLKLEVHPGELQESILTELGERETTRRTTEI